MSLNLPCEGVNRIVALFPCLNKDKQLKKVKPTIPGCTQDKPISVFSIPAKYLIYPVVFITPALHTL